MSSPPDQTSSLLVAVIRSSRNWLAAAWRADRGRDDEPGGKTISAIGREIADPRRRELRHAVIGIGQEVVDHVGGIGIRPVENQHGLAGIRGRETVLAERARLHRQCELPRRRAAQHLLQGRADNHQRDAAPRLRRRHRQHRLSREAQYVGGHRRRRGVRQGDAAGRHAGNGSSGGRAGAVGDCARGRHARERAGIGDRRAPAGDVTREGEREREGVVRQKLLRVPGERGRCAGEREERAVAVPRR